MLIAAAIVLAMVLYLIDKNQKWSTLWRVVKWCVWVIAGVILIGAIDYYVPDNTDRLIGYGIVIALGILFEWIRKIPDKNHD